MNADLLVRGPSEVQAYYSRERRHSELINEESNSYLLLPNPARNHLTSLDGLFRPLIPNGIGEEFFFKRKDNTLWDSHNSYHKDEASVDIKNTRPVTWPAPVAATPFEMFRLSSFHLAYGFVYGSMGLCILPITAGHLCPQSASIALGCMLMLCGISQLVCPIVGKVSDSWRAETVYARRRPFFHFGSFGAFIGVFGMYVSSYYVESYLLFCVFLFIGMSGLNTCYSIQSGLAPDLLIDENIDTISATVAANGLVGSSLGFFVIMATSRMDFHFVYPVYIVFVVLTLIVTSRVAGNIESRMENGGQIAGNPMSITYLDPENEANPPTMVSRLDWPVCPQVYGECTWRSIKRTLVIDKSENSDFYWVFVSRTCYYVGVSVQTFIQPFLRDVAMVFEESDQRFFLASIALTAQTVAAITAVSMGEYLKRKPDVSKRHVIYFAALIMTLVYAGFALVPMMNPYGFQWLMFISLPYGMGNGCFLAVDYAIAIAVIEKDKAAERLGVWGVSSFIGAAIGPMIFGVLIEIFGGELVNNLLTGKVTIQAMMHGTKVAAEHYTFNGYLLMLVSGGLSTALAGYLLRNVETPL